MKVEISSIDYITLIPENDAERAVLKHWENKELRAPAGASESTRDGWTLKHLTIGLMPEGKNGN